MTDFIHERPKDHPAPPPEKPATEKERVRKVYVYVAILFTAAFVLILWSFLMTHRSNQQILDQMEGSTNFLQSTLSENRQLQQENDALAGENDALEARIAALEQQLTDAARRESERAGAEKALSLQALALARLAEAYAAHNAGDDEAALAWLQGISPADLPIYDGDGTLPSPVSSYYALTRELTGEN